MNTFVTSPLRTNVTLYHYVHCPFCVRVRLVLGFLKIPFTSIVVPYDDEKTPTALTGKKMLPIAQLTNSAPINESLDIIRNLDIHDALKSDHYYKNKIEIDQWTDKFAGPIHALCIRNVRQCL